MATEWAVFADIVEADLLGPVQDEARRRAAVRAINKTTRDMRNVAASLIRDEVNFPAQYVGSTGKRLYVSKQANSRSLEGRITAAGRATSLARFIVGGAKKGSRGVTVEVEPGRARLMKRAFVMPLRYGKEFTDTKYNLGLAIRLKKGETLRNKRFARKVEDGLYLLYGPSVYQVFENNKGTGVKHDMIPEASDRLADEFLRLLGLPA